MHRKWVITAWTWENLEALSHYIWIELGQETSFEITVDILIDAVYNISLNLRDVPSCKDSALSIRLVLCGSCLFHFAGRVLQLQKI